MLIRWINHTTYSASGGCTWMMYVKSFKFLESFLFICGVERVFIAWGQSKIFKWPTFGQRTFGHLNLATFIFGHQYIWSFRKKNILNNFELLLYEIYLFFGIYFHGIFDNFLVESRGKCLMLVSSLLCFCFLIMDTLSTKCHTSTDFPYFCQLSGENRTRRGNYQNIGDNRG